MRGGGHAHIVAKLLEAVVTRLLAAIGFEHWMERGGIRQFFAEAPCPRCPMVSVCRFLNTTSENAPFTYSGE
jgi:hypothetical protein